MRLLSIFIRKNRLPLSFVALFLISSVATAAADNASRFTYTYVPTDIESIFSNQPVRSFLSDELGRTWVGTQSGLYVLDTPSKTRLSSTSRKPRKALSAEIVSIVSDSQSVVYFLTRSGAILRLSGHSDFQELRPSSGFRPNRGRSLFVSQSGKLIAVYTSGLDVHSTFNDGSPGSRAAPEYIGLELVADLVETDSYGVCGATKETLICGIDRQRHERFNVYTVSDSSRILAVAEGKGRNQIDIVLESGQTLSVQASGVGVMQTGSAPQLIGRDVRTARSWGDHKFIGTDKGLFYSQGPSNELHAVHQHLDSSVTGVFFDPNGAWISTETGLFHFTRTAVYSWPNLLRHPPLEVLGFADDDAGGYYIATSEGVYHRKPDHASHIKILSAAFTKQDDFKVASLGFSKNLLFVGSFSSGFRIFQRRGYSDNLIEIGSYLNDAGITVFKPFLHGMLIGTYESGLYFFHDGLLERVRAPKSWLRNLSPITSLAIIEAADKALVTSEQEIFLVCYSDHVYVCGRKQASSEPTQAQVLSSLTDKNGAIWLGTLNMGLMKISLDQLDGSGTLSQSLIPETSGLSVYSLVRESRDRLWMGTNEGIFLLSTKTLRTERFSRIHGLPSNDFHHGASLGLNNGDALFGGPLGYTRVRADELVSMPSTAKIWVKSIRVSNDTFDITKQTKGLETVELPTRNLGFGATLTLNDYRDIESTSYKYFLEGYDPHWIDNGSNNVVSYTSLPPGDYVFRARGADARGVWSMNEIRLPVTVLPPVWQAWWAWVCYAALVYFTFKAAKRINDRWVIQAHRLKLADEATAAFARLEDDYQEQREANEHLLRERPSSANELLNVVETSLVAHSTAMPEGEPFAADVLAKILTLRKLQSITSHSVSEQRTDMRAVVNELIAGLAAQNGLAARAIVMNDVEQRSVEAHHAAYLALVLQEALTLVLTARDYEEGPEPLVQVTMQGPSIDDAGDSRYTIHIHDSGHPDLDDAKLEAAMPLTFHLIETSGGEVVHRYDRGNALQVTLALATGTAIED
jgi:ligand-binding sensor domain-containing protein